MLRFYPIVMVLVRVVVTSFFGRIEVVGKENIPKTGPVIFAGNHPNALMDGFLVATLCGRSPLRFLSNAKLWGYPLLRLFLDTMGAIPVFRHEEHAGKVDNRSAFDRVFEVLEAAGCVGIFPEGISHTESQMVRLKTGTARLALGVSARGKVRVTLIPCGLSYLHRHRFRSQVLLEFGAPIEIDDEWLAQHAEDEQSTVLALTEHLRLALEKVTLNAPDWQTLRFVHSVRRLYKPTSLRLSPDVYVELSRRIIKNYLSTADDPALKQLRIDIEDYQARLDLLGLKDHQLSRVIEVGANWRKVLWRSLKIILLLPTAVPSALIHLPMAWLAVAVGDRFSYEKDDIATLKVFTIILLLPIIYLLVVACVWIWLSAGWALIAALLLPLSYFASSWLVELEIRLTLSVLTILRLTRLRHEIDELRGIRAHLVRETRTVAERYIDPDLPRLFERPDSSGQSGSGQV